MSLLWPDILHLGLHRERSWIDRGQTELAQWGARSADDVLDGLEHALADFKLTSRGRFRPQVSAHVSDAFAAIVLVPWQPALNTEAEWSTYALARFQLAGRAIDESWVVHVEFRQAGCAGLAYAFKRDWLDRLQAVLSRAGLDLQRVLPTCVCAYSTRPAVWLAKAEAMLLEEAEQISLMGFDPEGLIAFDVEPVVGSSEASRERLLARHTLPASVKYWSASGAPASDFMAAPVTGLPLKVWSAAI